MSSADPMVSAARASSMMDAELIEVLHEITSDQHITDYQQAILDEAYLRGILSGTEVDIIFRQRSHRSIGYRQ